MSISLMLLAAFVASSTEPVSPSVEDLAAELRSTEIAFARTVEDGDLEAFRSHLADDTVFSSAAGELRGPEAVVAAWSVFFQEGGPKIRWSPAVVSVLDDGSVGSSRGPYTLESKLPDGTVSKVGGTFFSVWRREGGVWKIILDGGTEPQPVVSPAPEDAEPASSGR